MELPSHGNVFRKLPETSNNNNISFRDLIRINKSIVMLIKIFVNCILNNQLRFTQHACLAVQYIARKCLKIHVQVV